MVCRLFQNYFCQLYHISLSCSPFWYHLLLIFHTSLLDIWRSERDCRLKVYSVGWTHYSVGWGNTLSVVHFTLSVVPVGCTYYSVAWAQYITDRSVVNMYSVGCAQCSISCKHILCRLYTLLGSLTFSGKVLKRDSIKNLTITTRGTSTGSVGCPRLQLPWRGSPRF